jgi:hypothetical protein
MNRVKDFVRFLPSLLNYLLACSLEQLLEGTFIKHFTSVRNLRTILVGLYLYLVIYSSTDTTLRGCMGFGKQSTLRENNESETTTKFVSQTAIQQRVTVAYGHAVAVLRWGRGHGSLRCQPGPKFSDLIAGATANGMKEQWSLIFLNPVA